MVLTQPRSKSYSLLQLLPTPSLGRRDEAVKRRATSYTGVQRVTRPRLLRRRSWVINVVHVITQGNKSFSRAWRRRGCKIKNERRPRQGESRPDNNLTHPSSCLRRRAGRFDEMRRRQGCLPFLESAYRVPKNLAKTCGRYRELPSNFLLLLNCPA